MQIKCIHRTLIQQLKEKLWYACKIPNSLDLNFEKNGSYDRLYLVVLEGKFVPKPKITQNCETLKKYLQGLRENNLNLPGVTLEKLDEKKSQLNELKKVFFFFFFFFFFHKLTPFLGV